MKFPKNPFFVVNWQKILESQVELGRVGWWGCKKNDQKCIAHSIPNCLKRLNNIVSKQLFFSGISGWRLKTRNSVNSTFPYFPLILLSFKDDIVYHSVRTTKDRRKTIEA